MKIVSLTLILFSFSISAYGNNSQRLFDLTKNWTPANASEILGLLKDPGVNVNLTIDERTAFENLFYKKDSSQEKSEVILGFLDRRDLNLDWFAHRKRNDVVTLSLETNLDLPTFKKLISDSRVKMNGYSANHGQQYPFFTAIKYERLEHLNEILRSPKTDVNVDMVDQGIPSYVLIRRLKGQGLYNALSILFSRSDFERTKVNLLFAALRYQDSIAYYEFIERFEPYRINMTNDADETLLFDANYELSKYLLSRPDFNAAHLKGGNVSPIKDCSWYGGVEKCILLVSDLRISINHPKPWHLSEFAWGFQTDLRLLNAYLRRPDIQGNIDFFSATAEWGFWRFFIEARSTENEGDYKKLGKLHEVFSVILADGRFTYDNDSILILSGTLRDNRFFERLLEVKGIRFMENLNYFNYSGLRAIFFPNDWKTSGFSSVQEMIQTGLERIDMITKKDVGFDPNFGCGYMYYNTYDSVVRKAISKKIEFRFEDVCFLGGRMNFMTSFPYFELASFLEVDELKTIIEKRSFPTVVSWLDDENKRQAKSIMSSLICNDGGYLNTALKPGSFQLINRMLKPDLNTKLIGSGVGFLWNLQWCAKDSTFSQTHIDAIRTILDDPSFDLCGGLDSRLGKVNFQDEYINNVIRQGIKTCFGGN